jgi:hypothetical protein
MKRIATPTQEQESAWNEWILSRPEKVRIVAERFDPWSLYRMKSTGHRVTIFSFSEGSDGKITMTVDVLGEFNLIAFERRVFGIDPDDLELCEPPGPNERVGAILDEDEALKALAKLHPGACAYCGETKEHNHDAPNN